MGTNYYFQNKESKKHNQNITQKKDKLQQEVLKLLMESDLIDDDREDYIELAVDNLFEVELDCEFDFINDEIHICKTSCGYDTCFETHRDLFTDVKELEEYYQQNKDDLLIVDEYDNEYTWEEFKEKVFNHKGKQSLFYRKDKYGYCWADYEFV